ncbi:MAG: DNA-directed RNA polymerase subunit L [Candidatus Bathyarchaeia archaeon]|nr:DNA-directed RNA polymerase subunit L [Candidatus Bathyarchaeota archaeon]
MEITVLKENKTELKLELKGEGHTLCILLQKELLRDPDVEIAGYDVPHPLLNSAILYVRARKGKNPRGAFIRALDKIKDKLEDFTASFEEAWTKVECS